METSASPGSGEDGTDNIRPQVASSMADQLWLPFYILVANPRWTGVILVAVNAAFIPLGAVFRSLVRFMTFPGTAVVLCIGFYLFVRLIVRCLAYPGSLRVMTRGIERDAAKQLRRSLVGHVQTVLDLGQMLVEPKQTMNGGYGSYRGETSGGRSLPTQEWTMLPTRSLEFRKKFEEMKASRDRVLLPLMSAFSMQMQIDTDAEGSPGDGSDSAPVPHDTSLSVWATSLGKETNASRAQDTEMLLNALSVFAASANELQPYLETLASAEMASFDQTREILCFEEGTVGSLREARSSAVKLAKLVHLISGDKQQSEASGVLGYVKEWWKAQFPFESLGSLNLLRADLAARHNGEQVWITGKDGRRIDCMLLQTRGNDPAEKAVVLCNPNAGIYEVHHLQSAWIPFYLSRGCNVLVFNYRGYGRSEGSPTPHDINNDGECIIDYLKNKKGIRKIAVHGESIGGILATHLASHCEVDLLVADRTFANLEAVAARLLAQWAATALKVSTHWDTNNVRNYLDATCPKVLCCDPDDEIIADVSSLKAGVALKIELGDESSAPPKRPVMIASSPSQTSMPSRVPGWSSFGFGTGSYVTVSDPLSEIPTLSVGRGKLTEVSISLFATHIYRIAKRSEGMESEYSFQDGDVDPDFGLHSEVESVSDSVTESGTERPNRRLGALPYDVHSCDISSNQMCQIWLMLARTDGCCGQLLGSAFARGYEGIRSWACSCVLWGPANVLPGPPPFFRQGADEGSGYERHIFGVSLADVDRQMQVIASDPRFAKDTDILVAAKMIKYLNDTVEVRRGINDGESAHISDSGSSDNTNSTLVVPVQPRSLGYLLPLHCGHNKALSREEMHGFMNVLQDMGW